MEDAFDARAMLRKGVVQSIDDTGEVQTVTVQTSTGATYSGIEVIQLFGSANLPPTDGAIAYLFCVAGDPANMVALLANPSARFGGLAPGEQVMYGADGSRVAIRQGGTIEILGGNQVTIAAPDANITATGTVTVAAPSVIINGVTVTASGITLGVATTIDGNLTVNGNIHATGIITP
jgi:phage baseplate assembly protein V